MLPVSALREALGGLIRPAPSAPLPRLAAEQVYERGLRQVLQVIVAP